MATKEILKLVLFFAGMFLIGFIVGISAPNFKGNEKEQIFREIELELRILEVIVEACPNGGKFVNGDIICTKL